MSENNIKEPTLLIGAVLTSVSEGLGKLAVGGLGTENGVGCRLALVTFQKSIRTTWILCTDNL